MNPTAIINRIKALILKPRETWPEIAADSAQPAELTKTLLIPLSALRAVAVFVGLCVIGYSILGTNIRLSMGRGIGLLITTFIAGVAGPFLVAWVLDKLAPKYQAEVNFTQSFKLAAWSFVPAYLAGAFAFLPILAPLAILGLYGLYLMYVGLPVMKKCPLQQTTPYFIVSLLACIGVAIVLGAVQAIFTRI